MVSAWGCKQQLVLAQIATEENSNEIAAIPKLLRLLSLRGSTVTVDALNCQRAIAQQIVDQDGGYAMALKGNQQSLHDDVRRFFDDPQSKVETAKPVVDGDHGRIETRIAAVSTDIGWLQEIHRWPGLAAIGKMERMREKGGKTITETAYYLLSSALTCASISQYSSPKRSSDPLTTSPWIPRRFQTEIPKFRARVSRV